MHHFISRPLHARGPRGAALALLALVLLALAPGRASALARVQGRVVDGRSGEPVGFADVLLVPADTTRKRMGGLTDAGGVFTLSAAPGRYTLQVRALSYAPRKFEALELRDGEATPILARLDPEAIEQEEIVVEATVKKSTEAAMLAARRKAETVGDAVSAEQMRRAPDRNASDVLKRVTGLSVADNRYVYVRGMGERYNSTEVDGVRVVSPEQNKRVVPMDMFPAALLDNIVVQKAWSADRSGEFSGGDVQVHLKEFPGQRAWSFSLSQGMTQGTTFRDRLTYTSGRADWFGFGAGDRGIPTVVDEISGGKPLAQGSPPNGFPVSTLQQVEKEFTNVWSPKSGFAVPNGSYAFTYGDQFRLFGHPLGFIQSATLSRSFEQRAEVQRFTDDGQVPDAQYDMQRSTESVQLGANASLNYRLTPAHRLSVRGLYTNKADDEVLTYTGLDPDAGQFHRRATKLMYIQRQIGYGTVEGQHDFAALFGSTFDWKFTRSGAHRQQPDKREAMYLRVPIDETDPGTWGLAVGRREYGDLVEDGWGTTLKLETPYRLGDLGKGRVTAGFDRQSRVRDNGYRRFDFIPRLFGQDAPPESLYDVVNEVTSSRDNYDASQLIEAFFLSVDVPMGRRLRGNLGLRRELGEQSVRSRDLFDPGFVVAEGGRSHTDWLAGANLTWSIREQVHVRAAASRTLNRPDMDDLSPLPALDFVGDKIRIGNPTLERARITNYDLRAEMFPGGNELYAAGAFYKELDRPIEPALFGTNGQLGVRPENSIGGRNMGVEFEARTSLGRLLPRLRSLSVNANASFISSRIRSSQATDRGNGEHPLVGQAPMMLNVGLTWTSTGGMNEFTLSSTTVGDRLKELNQTQVNTAGDGIPNLYSRGLTTLDLTASCAPFRGGRLRFAAGNLLDRPYQEFVGPIEMRRYSTGRTYSLSLSVGS